MGHTVNNIAIILIGLGVLLLGVYIARASGGCYNDYFLNREAIRRQRIDELNYEPDIYRYRPSKVFKRMFTQPPIWTGYQDFDAKDNTEKLYIK